MTLLRTAALALPLQIALAFPLFAADPVTLETQDQNLSYALGISSAAQLSDGSLGFALDVDAFAAALRVGLDGTEGQMTVEEAEKVLNDYFAGLAAEAKAVADAAVAKKAEENKMFMEENAKKDGVVTTESGLQYKVLKTGEGESPTPADTVSVHYTGRLLDGTVFDSSRARGEPAEFPVNRVIAGWTEALQLMQPGTQLEVWIPSELAYGERGAGGAIGPNEPLNFEMELLSIVAQ